MALIPTLTTFSAGTLIKSSDVNANFDNIRNAFNNTAVLTDVARTISAVITHAADVLFTDGLYDIGKSGATRPRDGFFSRNLVVGAALTVVGAVAAASFAGDGSALTALSATQLTTGTVPDARFPATLPALSGVNLTALNASNLASGTVPPARITGVGTLAADLLFTDATYDIGKTGATRPRDGFFSRNVVIGGTLSVTGTTTLTGKLLMGSAIAGASAAGEIVLGNQKRLWGVDNSGTVVVPLIYTDSVGYPQVGATDFSSPIKIARDTAANFPAFSTNYTGVIAIDTTNNRLCFYSGAGRFYVAGSSF
jgi:hypothetical protein